MNTPPPSPPPAPRFVPQPAYQHSRGNEPPRQQAERQGMKDRFASKMEREEGGKPSQNSDMGATNSADAIPSGGKLPIDRDGGDGGQSGSGQRDLQLQLSGTQPLASAGQSSATSLDTAALQRMAAQIADAAPGTLSGEASITFPDGSLAESAQIKREPDGSIAIRIAGMDPRLTALQNGRAQLELLNGLALRRLKVSSLSLERAKPDQPGRDSTMSRVV